MPWFLMKLAGCSPNCAPGASKAPQLLGPRNSQQESKGGRSCVWVLLLLFPNISIPRCWAAAWRCQNTRTWHLQVADFFPSFCWSQGHQTRGVEPVSGSPISGHIWAHHQATAHSPAAPMGPAHPCATPAWPERKPPASTQKGCADWERENRCYFVCQASGRFQQQER